MMITSWRNAYAGWAALLGLITLALVACAGQEVPPPPALVDSPPTWSPGDRWLYDWTSGADKGSKTAEVMEIKELNKVRYYVLRIGYVDHYYTVDLKWSGSVRDGKVEARMVPPQPWFVWPLEVGRRWGHRGIYEQRDETKKQTDTFAVVSAETISVPAGRFYAFKVIREAGPTDSDQYWYAPEVGWYVKWIGRRGKVKFEEQLRKFIPAPTLIPEPAPERAPTKTK
jgi:hypothetical protein